MPVALGVHDVRQRYGAAEALRSVSPDGADGELVGLLGPFGARRAGRLRSLRGCSSTSR